MKNKLDEFKETLGDLKVMRESIFQTIKLLEEVQRKKNLDLIAMVIKERLIT